MRVISDNAADRAVITAVTAAGGLVPANLQNDYKTVVCRSTTTTLVLTLTWTVAESIQAVVLPLIAMTAAGTIQVQGYTNAADTTAVSNYAAAVACPNAALPLWNWGALPPGANAFSYGGGNVARAWLPAPVLVKKLVITLVDTGNSAGYIEAARLVCGRYWEPTKQVDYGAGATPIDRSVISVNDAGDSVAELGTMSKKISFSLSKMIDAEADALWNILSGNGVARPAYVTLFPGHANPATERRFQLWGRLVTTPMMSIPSFNVHNATLEVAAV